MKVSILPILWITLQCSWSSMILGAVLVKIAFQLGREVEDVGHILTAKWVLDPVLPYLITHSLKEGHISISGSLRCALIGMGLTHWSFSYVTSYHLMLIIAFFNGIFNAVLHVCAMTAVSLRYPQPAEYFQAARLTSILGGVLLSPVLLEPCRLIVGDSLYAFWVLSIMNIFTAATWHAGQDPEFTQSDELAQAGEDAQKLDSSSVHLRLYIATALLSGLNITLRSWLPAFTMKIQGMGESESQVVLTVYSGGGLVASTLAIVLANWLPHPRKLVLGCIVTGGVGLLGARHSPYFLFLLGAGIAPTVSAIYAWVRRLPAFDPRKLGIAICSGSVGGLLAPWFISFIGLYQLWAVIAALLFASLIALTI